LPGLLLSAIRAFLLCYTFFVSNSLQQAPDFTPGSVAEVQQIVVDAKRDGFGLVPIGGGTQIDRSLYSSGNRFVSTRHLNSIVEYNPRDLVVVAQAGMTVSKLQETLSENGQTLPLEVAAPDNQTLGGIVSARASSLSRAGNGSVRDWLIGCNVIDSNGEKIVAGGKVVKNVAGYDLPKLYCGSWGTLGVITQVAFKLAPLPEASRLLLMTLSSERNSEEIFDSLAQTAPATFTYLLNTPAARQILGPDTPEAQFVALGFDGHAEAVDTLIQRAVEAAAPYVFQTIDLPVQVGARFRSSLRDLSIGDAPLRVRCSILPSQVGAFARMLEWTAKRAGFESLVFADASVGTVWAHMKPKADDSDPEDIISEAIDMHWMRLLPDFKDKCARVGGTTFMEAIPDIWRKNNFPVISPDGAEMAWTKRLKSELDPHGVFPSIPFG
jgi:glycolate oxidase FAD binding subunit